MPLPESLDLKPSKHLRQTRSRAQEYRSLDNGDAPQWRRPVRYFEGPPNFDARKSKLLDSICVRRNDVRSQPETQHTIEVSPPARRCAHRHKRGLWISAGTL